MKNKLKKEPHDSAKFKGFWKFKCLDKYGNVKWKEAPYNRVVNEGLTNILDTVFHNQTPIAAWYVAPFYNNDIVAATSTYTTHTYTEFAEYSQTSRPAWVEAASSGQSITNSANKATFSISGASTLYGAVLVSGATKSDVASGNTLMCGVQFSSSRAVESGDTLQVTYTISAADDGA